MLRQYQIGSGSQTTLPPRVIAYHEFYQNDFRPRDHYAPIWDHIRHAGQPILGADSREDPLSRQTKRVTPTAYLKQSKSIECERPFDIVPRIIPADEWRVIEAGLKQRVRALNLFLKDIYSRQDILKDGVLSPELIYNGKDFRHELMDISPPQDIYTHIGGIDLIRDEAGQYLVLKDNLRAPSGVSRMIENRIIQQRVLPEFFAHYRVRQVEHYSDLLRQALRFLSPRGEGKANIVLLTPSVASSTRSKYGFLAKEMGVKLAEGRGLVCKNERVYLKTTFGLRQVDVLYRLGDDGSLDSPASGNASELDVAGIVNAWRCGNLAIVNAPGAGIADDKAVYAHVPDIIRYYLGEEPVLENVPTYEMTDDQDQAYVLDNLESMVVKAVAESGGYGMLMGPLSTPTQRAEFAMQIRANPRNYVAQPVIQFSRHLCYLDGELESRHLDLRPFVISGRDIEVVPGGLTRVAMTEGSLMVNSSQGGGSKDTWVLAD